MAKRNENQFSSSPTELIVPVDEFKSVIDERIRLGENILNQEVNNQTEFEKVREEYGNWNDYNSEYLKQAFNKEKNEYKERYDKSAMLVGFSMRPETPNEKLGTFKESVNAKLLNLKKLLAKAELLKCSGGATKEKIQRNEELETNKIFIVHGHDNGAKLDVARTLEKLDLSPIILAEQPNQGQTIIEKFELYSNVGFAVVILTADDLGKTKTNDDYKYRARQNVIMELGYFIGKLGRNKVFPLYESGVELPSDLHGIIYNPLDEAGNWKFQLGKELSSAGYNINANKLL